MYGAEKGLGKSIIAQLDTGLSNISRQGLDMDLEQSPSIIGPYGLNIGAIRDVFVRHTESFVQKHNLGDGTDFFTWAVRTSAQKANGDQRIALNDYLRTSRDIIYVLMERVADRNAHFTWRERISNWVLDTHAPLEDEDRLRAAVLLDCVGESEYGFGAVNPTFSDLAFGDMMLHLAEMAVFRAHDPDSRAIKTTFTERRLAYWQAYAYQDGLSSRDAYLSGQMANHLAEELYADQLEGIPL